MCLHLEFSLNLLRTKIAHCIPKQIHILFYLYEIMVTVLDEIYSYILKTIKPSFRKKVLIFVLCSLT